jgi:TRAP-type C4-dicarboxylate transport system substrate-binding protein
VYSRADLSRTVALVVALFSTAVPAGAVAREFRAADTQSEDYPTVQALYYMGSLIAEQGGGRLQIRVFHSHQLGEEKETIEQTRAGAIDLNRTNVALIGSFVLAMNVLAMPFLLKERANTAGVTIVSDFDRKPFEDAMAGIYAKAQADPAASALIEQIRKVE